MNYVVCVLAGLILTGRGLTQTDGKGMPVTIVFGVVTVRAGKALAEIHRLPVNNVNNHQPLCQIAVIFLN